MTSVCEGVRVCVGACVNGVDRGHFMITHPRSVDVLDSFPKRGRPRFEFPVDRGHKPTLIPQVKFLPKIGRVHNLYMLYRLCAKLCLAAASRVIFQ